jgi:hypothetical protein
LELNDEYLEKLIIKNMLSDKTYFILISGEVESRYFNNSEASELFTLSTEYFNNYNEIPNLDILKESSNNKTETEKYIKDLDVINIEDYQEEFIYNETEKWLKETALKYAIMDSVDIIKTDKEDNNKTKDLIEAALIKTLKKDLGLNY